MVSSPPVSSARSDSSLLGRQIGQERRQSTTEDAFRQRAELTTQMALLQRRQDRLLDLGDGGSLGLTGAYVAAPYATSSLAPPDSMPRRYARGDIPRCVRNCRLKCDRLR